jgi:membrane-associated phospholipid phosphatase
MKPFEPLPADDSSARQISIPQNPPWAWLCMPQSRPWTGAVRILDIVRKACGVFELITFTYLAWLGAIFLLYHRNIDRAPRFVAIHIAIAAAIISLAVAARHSHNKRRHNKLIHFARHWYPLPLYIFFFEELQYLVHAIYPGWFDRYLIQFDFNLAGIHPSLWLAQFASLALNDFMQFAYMTYFLYLIILPAILYVQRERLAFWTTMVSTAIAHYSVYVIAILFPIESPYFSLASLQSKPLTGGYFTAAINLIEHFGRVHGAAFPSAHVAGSMVAILASWKYRRWLFWICLPFFASMCIATVYGRYHYVADVLAGLIVGAIGFAAGNKLMQCKNALPRTES